MASSAMETTNRDKNILPRNCRAIPRFEKSNDIDDIVVSQSLFNSDAAYEWIMPIFEAVEFHTQPDTSKYPA